MRLRDLRPAGMVVTTVAAGCSRLTFVKPKLKRHGYRAGRTGIQHPRRRCRRPQDRGDGPDRPGPAAPRCRPTGRRPKPRRKAALKADSKSADAHTLLAMIEEQRGHPAQAGAITSRRVELAPARGGSAEQLRRVAVRQRPGRRIAGLVRSRARRSRISDARGGNGQCRIVRIDRRPGRARRSRSAQCPVDWTRVTRSRWQAWPRTNSAPDAISRPEPSPSVAWRAAPATRQVLQLASQIEQKLGDTAAAARYVQRMRVEFPEQGRVTRPGDASQ